MDGGGPVQFLKRLYLGGGETILKMYTIHEGSGTIFKTKNCHSMYSKSVVQLLYNNGSKCKFHSKTNKKIRLVVLSWQKPETSSCAVFLRPFF